MILRGTVHDGKVIFDPGPTLPDGTAVDVTPRRATKRRPSRKPGRKDKGLLGLLDFAVIDDGPTDLAAEHDHYIYGIPKRGSKRPRITRSRRGNSSRRRRG